MYKYSDLVQYTKDNHISWNTDLFDVLRGFFNQYSPQPSSSQAPLQDANNHYSNTIYTMQMATGKFKEPENGEYSIEDLFKLFS